MYFVKVIYADEPSADIKVLTRKENCGGAWVESIEGKKYKRKTARKKY